MANPVLTHFDDRARKVALAVQQATGIEQILLFGSRARGDYVVDSDIDLLVVHQPDSAVYDTCQRAASQAVQTLYNDYVTTEIVLVSPSLFEYMQFGLNHVAAHATRDGVTPMGNPYERPDTEPHPKDQHRIEAMERAYHGRRSFTVLSNTLQLGDSSYEDPAEFDITFGEAAQRTLEHALKAVIAAMGKEYKRIHNLAELETQATQAVPGFKGLQSPLQSLSAFAGGDVYTSPELEQDADTLFQKVHTDVTYLFALVQQKADFDPWSVKRSDFKF